MKTRQFFEVSNHKAQARQQRLGGYQAVGSTQMEPRVLNFSSHFSHGENDLGTTQLGKLSTIFGNLHARWVGPPVVASRVKKITPFLFGVK